MNVPGAIFSRRCSFQFLMARGRNLQVPYCRLARLPKPQPIHEHHNEAYPRRMGTPDRFVVRQMQNNVRAIGPRVLFEVCPGEH
jgi:hypothetical protein